MHASPDHGEDTSREGIQASQYLDKSHPATRTNTTSLPVSRPDYLLLMDDDSLDALAHWSSFGQAGVPPAARYIPTPEDLARFSSFVSPASGAWSYHLDASQTAGLLRGFEPDAMEDKWFVYSDDVSESGAASVHFLRSWTGRPIVTVTLQLEDVGSRVTQATWETDAAHLVTPTEAFARSTFEECCVWVLRIARPVADSSEE